VWQEAPPFRVKAMVLRKTRTTIEFELAENARQLGLRYAAGHLPA
jgi:hypothetical protein